MEKQSEQQEIKDIITSREDGFGHRLKIARNERNLSTADVARELRLDEKVILALENEDHQRLPVSAFVCGYIRNYAKFLNVQPEPLIDCYKKGISEDNLDPELKITKGKPKGSSVDVSKIVVPVVSVLIIVALVFGGWILWGYVSDQDNASNNSVPPAEISENVNNSDTIQSDAPDSLLLPSLNESDYESPKEATSDSKQETSISDKTAVTAEVSAVDMDTSGSGVSAQDEGSLPVLDTLPTTDSLPAEAVSEIDTAAVQANNVSARTANSTSEGVMAQNDDHLVLEFSGNSWIIIKDAENKKLATGLKKAGQTLHLKGKPPYNLFLGDGRAVKVSIHGKIYDHSQYINDKNIARFNVE